MPRRFVSFVPETYYHVYNRGNNRQPVFFEAANYLYFLQGVKNYVRPTAQIIAYCLMPTHFHMLVRIRPQPSQASDVSPFSRAMQKLMISYTKAINKRFSRVGSLFQGAIQAKPICRYDHLLNLCVYIHANPVKDNLTQCPEDWQYSNYLEWLGERNGTLLDQDFIRENFESASVYRSLVTKYLNTRKFPDAMMLYLQEVEN